MDVKAVHDNLLPTKSAYYRARYPEDWFWADVQTRLAALTATAVEKVHYLLASQMWAEVPPEFDWTLYGPADEAAQEAADATAEQEAADVELARSVAASMRGH